MMRTATVLLSECVAYPTIDYQFQAGDAIYEDINHDGNIDHQDIVYLGNSNPILTGGFGPNIRYKNISVSAFFNFRYGNKVINQMRMSLENMSSYNNQSGDIRMRMKRPRRLICCRELSMVRRMLTTISVPTVLWRTALSCVSNH
jgi:hypothetical protein